MRNTADRTSGLVCSATAWDPYEYPTSDSGGRCRRRTNSPSPHCRCSGLNVGSLPHPRAPALWPWVPCRAPTYQSAHPVTRIPHSSGAKFPFRFNSHLPHLYQKFYQIFSKTACVIGLNPEAMARRVLTLGLGRSAIHHPSDARCDTSG